MAHVIAVAGKGGVGKTPLCGMLIQYLCEQGKGPILAVDADANSNLNEVLGVEVALTTNAWMILYRLYMTNALAMAPALSSSSWCTPR